MRVAIVTQGYLDGGGVSAIVSWLRLGLAEHGHEVHVHDLAASSRDSRSRRFLSPATWRLALNSEEEPADPELFHWGANWVELESQRYKPRAGLTAALDTYDLIQVVAGGPALGLSVGRATPPKALQVATTLLMERKAHLRDMPPAKQTAKAFSLGPLHRLEVKALRGVNEVMVENSWMERWVREQGQTNVTFAPPGIDIDVFRPARTWDPTRPIIAFGRLADTRKDWPTAVSAYEHFVATAGMENQLVLAGKGPLSPALERKLAASAVRDRIRVRLDVPEAELPQLLGEGSVFLQSSLEEGLGLAGLEAMACGLPMVATRTVGSSEYVIDGENGFLVAQGQEAAVELARSLVDVLTSGGEAMSAEAVRTCRDRYSSVAALKNFLAIYERLMERTR